MAKGFNLQPETAAERRIKAQVTASDIIGMRKFVRGMKERGELWIVNGRMVSSPRRFSAAVLKRLWSLRG